MRMVAQALMIAFIVGGPLIVTWLLFKNPPAGYQDRRGFHYGEKK